MKAFLLTLLLLLSSPVAAQKLPNWYRVYTFDESFIDMDTSSVILGGDIGRVTFRWTFDQPETLTGNPPVRYQTRLETIEFRCSDRLYRYYEVSLVDPSGKTIRSELMRSPYTWHPIRTGSVTGTISVAACELIAHRIDPTERERKLAEQSESDRVMKFALSIKDTLERSRDFKPIVDKFFITDFVKRYLNEDETNWFYNLNRDTALKASQAELKRFYVASLNAGYLTSLYLISHSPMDDDQVNDAAPQPAMIPADLYQLIDHHPYTVTYKSKGNGYDYLAENVDSVVRMRSYTDLLEKIATLMRKHVMTTQADRSRQYQDMLEDGGVQSWDCPEEYLGLPRGTKLFDMTLPTLHLQFAEINGKLKVVSAIDSSRPTTAHR